jgi:small GTP-binding protein
MASPALQKKISMVGSFGVGKTSLVRRYVESIFSDRYQTNIGVRIDKKLVQVAGRDVNLVLWDLAGEDEITNLSLSHLRGSSGYILVADGCREASFEKALELQSRIHDPLGKVPFVFAINKVDLLPDWRVGTAAIEDLKARGWNCFLTSAKRGDVVEEMFLTLATGMLNKTQ